MEAVIPTIKSSSSSAVRTSPTTPYTPHLKRVLRTYQSAAVNSLSGPNGVLTVISPPTPGQDAAVTVAGSGLISAGFSAPQPASAVATITRSTSPGQGSGSVKIDRNDRRSPVRRDSGARGRSITPTGTFQPPPATSYDDESVPFQTTHKFPVQRFPILSAADRGPCEHTETVLEGQLISCFVVGGEKRLCIPQILNSVLLDFSVAQINQIRDDLQIFCSQCTPEQLDTLKNANIIPRSATSCGLITQSDAERLCSSLLNRPVQVGCSKRSRLLPPVPATHAAPASGTGELASAALNGKLAEQVTGGGTTPFTFRVYHECFGKCEGICTPDAYAQPGAPCIECVECSGIFGPEKFVSHAHRALENRTCHWGFDSANWRAYLLLAKNQDDYEGLLRVLDEFKARFEGQLPSRAYGKRTKAESPAITEKREFSIDVPKKPKYEYLSPSSSPLLATPPTVTVATSPYFTHHPSAVSAYLDYYYPAFWYAPPPHHSLPPPPSSSFAPLPPPHTKTAWLGRSTHTPTPHPTHHLPRSATVVTTGGTATPTLPRSRFAYPSKDSLKETPPALERSCTKLPQGSRQHGDVLPPNVALAPPIKSGCSSTAAKRVVTLASPKPAYEYLSSREPRPHVINPPEDLKVSAVHIKEVAAVPSQVPVQPFLSQHHNPEIELSSTDTEDSLSDRDQTHEEQDWEGSGLPTGVQEDLRLIEKTLDEGGLDAPRKQIVLSAFRRLGQRLMWEQEKAASLTCLRACSSPQLPPSSQHKPGQPFPIARETPPPASSSDRRQSKLTSMEKEMTSLKEELCHLRDVKIEEQKTPPQPPYLYHHHARPPFYFDEWKVVERPRFVRQAHEDTLPTAETEEHTKRERNFLITQIPVKREPLD